jgi:hypothetical protein
VRAAADQQGEAEQRAGHRAESAAVPSDMTTIHTGIICMIPPAPTSVIVGVM